MRVELELFKQVKIIIYLLASFGIAQIGRMSNSYSPCNVGKAPDPKIEGISCFINGGF